MGSYFGSWCWLCRCQRSIKIVVRSGSIKIGQTIFAEEAECKVRALFDDKGKTIKEVAPGYPAKVFGFTDVPQVGASVTSEPHTAIKEIAKSKNVFDLRRLKDDEIPLILKLDKRASFSIF